MAVDEVPPTETSSIPPFSSNACNIAVVDPPPPYPSRERRRASRAQRHGHRIQTSQHTQISSADSYSDQDAQASPQLLLTPGPFSDTQEEGDGADQSPTTSHHARRLIGRPRSHSHTSTASAAPSLGQTVLSLFRTDDDCDFRDEATGRGQIYLPLSNEEYGHQVESSRRHEGGIFTLQGMRRYFRPLSHGAYWWSLFHLAVLNFPYALAAWIYLFVFTVAGTTLLMALPLGAILCFFDLIGARAFARGELALQTRFHSPLSYPAPYPPRPIFIRRREATSAEIEAGAAAVGDLVRERSFYKNAYAMLNFAFERQFTDPTSFQALFYFIVIKPAITIVFTLIIIVLVLPALVLVLPAPAALRAVHRLGIWQANVAIEGLYLAGEVTWIGPDNYQVHQLYNDSDRVCVTIQCYQYAKEDCVHDEYFDYLESGTGVKKPFYPDSD
ncbi:hypothetical protein DXG03_002128 [Asterophora parasitica]|uniref:Uncharacterized protein n=1 Tax=Asterophora parasitica TaxID=117018 RepID=A0A9P7G608_9AGAR|nr:hypothetical protein DXG03_002128 [Asterophora parasitica]